MSPEYFRTYRATNRDKLQGQRRARRAGLEAEALEELRARERVYQARRREKEKTLIQFARDVIKGMNTDDVQS
jgi:hypothetical protein